MNIAICESDQTVQNRIYKIADRYFNGTTTEMQFYRCSSGKEFLALKKTINLLFLDMELPDMSGIDVKTLIEKEKRDIHIVFVGNNYNHILDAFGRNVYRFLMKPIEDSQVWEVLECISSEIQERIIIMNDIMGEVHTIRLDEICYIQAQDKYTHVYMLNGEFTVRKTLTKWQQMLSVNEFCRINRSYIIAYNNCKLYNNKVVVCKYKKEIKVNKDVRDDLITTFGSLNTLQNDI